MRHAPRPHNLGPHDDNVYDKTLRLVSQHAKLKAAVVVLQQQHMQMLLVITKAAGGAMTLTRQDFDAIKGCSLMMGKDTVTGDLLFRVEEPDAQVDVDVEVAP